MNPHSTLPLACWPDSRGRPASSCRPRRGQKGIMRVGSERGCKLLPEQFSLPGRKNLEGEGGRNPTSTDTVRGRILLIFQSLLTAKPQTYFVILTQAQEESLKHVANLCPSRCYWIPTSTNLSQHGPWSWVMGVGPNKHL